MFAALLTTLLFSISAMCGHRTATRLGGVEANFWRIAGAFVFLAVWANVFGTGTAGAAFSLFILSGLAGIGLVTPRIFKPCRGSAAGERSFSRNVSPRQRPS